MQTSVYKLLNYYVYQSTPFDLMGTPDFSSISMD